ncbi:phosphotransferase enzyme family protein [Longitalea arenae]|uniref:phosphotransferase enzyme family protein n=1 Tax=Longitalea arenae TaxID=2812558 RepID=UPI0019689F48|nr:phosphotransferase [Longitalea arenae]
MHATTPIFPVQYSTLSALALKGAIAAGYGLNNISCSFLLRGVSDTYLVRSNTEQYIFKIYRDSHRSITEIRGEVELLNILHDQGAKIAYPIRDLNGQQIQSFNAPEGIRYGVLFSFARGKSMHDLSDRQLAVTGREMAVIHTISANAFIQYERKSYDLNNTIIQPLKKVKPAFADIPEDYDYLLKTAERVIQKLNDFDTARFSNGYCHYDYLPKNFHFDENDNITFFDFDFMGRGYLVNDVMSFWLHLALHTTFNKITREEAERQFDIFIKSYQSGKHISADEVKAIPYLSFGFWIFYMGFHYEQFDDFSNSFFNTRFLKERVALIRKLVDNYCAFDQ